MFILRPSSPVKLGEPASEPANDAFETPEQVVAVALPVEAVSDEPYIDLGLPIPETYNVDILRAMIQDPFHIFIYWEVRDENLKALTKYFSPEEAARFQTTLKLTELTGGHEAYFTVAARGRYWMMVFPDRDYEFEIGVRSREHGYISLLRSNRVHTPRGTVSPVTADEHEYQMSPPVFAGIIEASGFGADQSMNITVAAAPGAATQVDLVERSMSKLPGPVREAVFAASTGEELTIEMIQQFPEPLKSELARLFEATGGRIASVGLMHYLPELLREVIEDDREWIGDHVHPVHFTPRFIQGSSGFTTLLEEYRRPVPNRRPRLPSSPTLARGANQATDRR